MHVKAYSITLKDQKRFFDFPLETTEINAEPGKNLESIAMQCGQVYMFINVKQNNKTNI